MSVETWSEGSRAVLLDLLPSGVFVLDGGLRIVDHNRTFTQGFGEGRGKACHEVLKGTATPCSPCPARAALVDGEERLIEMTRERPRGGPAHFLVRLRAVESGGERFVAGVSTDVTATKRLQQEYRTLFEKVPCYVAVINRDFRVVRGNEACRRVFGDPRGDFCYSLFKGRKAPCDPCPALETFADGAEHVSSHVGRDRTGETTHYVVSTAALPDQGETVSHVIEMAIDVTDQRKLEAELSMANLIRETLFESSLDAIVVLDAAERVILMNGAAEALWGRKRVDVVGKPAPTGMLPAPFERLLGAKTAREQGVEAEVRRADGSSVPVHLAAVPLRHDGRLLGVAATVRDLRRLKALEKARLEAERLAAVGQTVAGLAHGIKNILTGLKGGMYAISSGLDRGDAERTARGRDMLERNMERISTLARNLLAFSKGDVPQVEWLDPAAVAREVVDLYRDAAEQSGVALDLEVRAEVAPAPFDREGLHSCLANLVSNALDACLVSQTAGCTVSVAVDGSDEAVCFEVRDSGCGMDYEVKQKVFSSFFTTKGSGGTGLGLLLTRKIVQQHGGAVAFESSPSEGTAFRLSFPRERLPRPSGPGPGESGGPAPGREVRDD